jgi:membrane protease YdiL (CAAX protease family)
MLQETIRRQPASIQMMVLMGIWLVMQLLLAGAAPALLRLLADETLTFSAYLAAPEEYPRVTIGIQLIGALLQFLVPATLFARLVSDRPATFLCLNNRGDKGLVPWLVVLGCSLIFILPPIGGLLQEIGFGASADEMQRERQAMEAAYFVTNDMFTLLRNIVLLAVVPAVCEELFFRGVLQRYAYILFKKKWPAIIFTSLIFAAIHNSIYNFIPIVIASCLLGYIFFATGNLWRNILVHFVYNAAQIVILYIAKQNPSFATMIEENNVFILTSMAAAVVLAAFCVRMVQRKRSDLLLEEILPEKLSTPNDKF